MFLLGNLVSLKVLWPFALASLLWVLFHLLIRFHPRGIEYVGGILFLLGFVWWVSEPMQNPPFGMTLFLLGFVFHALGRILHWMKVSKK